MASAWERAKAGAGKVTEVLDWPVEDAAAVIGVETAWLAGLMLAVKFLSMGLYKEFFAEPRCRR